MYISETNGVLQHRLQNCHNNDCNVNAIMKHFCLLFQFLQMSTRLYSELEYRFESWTEAMFESYQSVGWNPCWFVHFHASKRSDASSVCNQNFERLKSMYGDILLWSYSIPIRERRFTIYELRHQHLFALISYDDACICEVTPWMIHWTKWLLNEWFQSWMTHWIQPVFGLTGLDQVSDFKQQNKWYRVVTVQPISRDNTNNMMKQEYDYAEAQLYCA